MSFLFSGNNVQLSGKTLIVPVVSTANISQLAVDLIIASLSLKRLVAIDPEYFVPVVGGRDDGGDGICLPAELYGNDRLDIVILQQRSPVLKAKKQDFISSLCNFVQASGVAAVLFLSGVDTLNRTDTQMHTPTYYLTPSKGADLKATPLGPLTTLPIPQYTSPVPPKPKQGSTDSELPSIPGGGLTRRILSSLPSDWKIPTAALLQFVLEGDNRHDALMFASVVAKVLDIDSQIQEWKQPESWNQGLFGTPHDQSLYG